MDTFLLNPNVAAQTAPSQQSDSFDKTDNDEEFTSFFNEAVDSIEGQTDTINIADTENIDSDDALSENILLEDILSEDILSEDAMTVAMVGGIKETNFLSNVSEVSLPEIDISNTETLSITAGTTDVASEQLFIPDNSETFKSTEAIGQQFSSFQTQESPAPVSLPGNENELSSTSKVENILLQQIQQILDQDGSNEPIVITGSNVNLPEQQDQIETLNNLSNPLLTDTENEMIQAKQLNSAHLLTEDSNPATQKSAKLEGAQQKFSEQYFNAKLDASKDENAGQFQQNKKEQKGFEQASNSEIQAGNQNQTLSAADGKPVESTFGQQLNATSPIDTKPVSVEGKYAPGAETPIPEKEIVNTLIQRFNVNPRLQTSKLSMQLHPAELGALKIDILVKGDSIKANIVAQSHQVLETLEKHMPRLRAILEDQGFNVDFFEISMEGDGGKQKELFQEQFNSQQQEFASNESSSSQTDSFEALLDSQEDNNDSEKNNSGVNLTA